MLDSVSKRTNKYIKQYWYATSAFIKSLKSAKFQGVKNYLEFVEMINAEMTELPMVSGIGYK